MTDDLISRQKAIDALMDALNDVGVLDAEDINTVFQMLPPEQPEITHEQAVGYLQSTGWMQSHDLQMMLDGIHKFTTQPERIKGRWLSHYDYCKKHGYIPSGVIALWWCDQCEQGVEHPTNFCPNCGAEMRGEHDD